MVLEESNVIAREMNEVKWDIDFQNLNYQVNTWCSGRRKYKDILRDVHGEFRGRELTAVIGQSGSGKSSLLNVLSGYTTKNVSGTIRLNGRNDVRGIRNRSKFIMQNYSLHNYITVEEAMMFAANLKLREVNHKTRRRKITCLLDLLGLGKVLDRYSGDLSGGEQKRLSIALELIDDPQILFLDEPTTGLDSSSSTQCIKLLKRLAVEGKTIICSLHTPSAIIFELFDNVYTIADGCCIYQGPSSKLIPFLSELDLTCPETFSPADFLLEIANNDYGMQNSRLTEKIKNGIISTRQMTQRKLSNYHDDNLSIEFNHSMELKKFLHELFQLLRRNFLISSRDKTMTQMRLGIHLTLAIFIGLMYSGIGDDASNILNIYRFLFFNIFFLMFTAFSSLQTSFPLDLPIIQREHFNLWYSTASYYSALLIADIPIIMSTNFVYIVITYFMTHQPMDIFRFSAYYMVILVLSIAAQGLGLIAGSLLNRKSKQILNGLSGEFCSSELTAIVGPSGSGKSTLVDVLSGYKRSNVTGTFRVNGKVFPTSAVRRESSYVPQENKLHDYLTVGEAMIFAATFRNLKEQKKQEKAEQILSSLGMIDHMNSFVKHLSGGQQKRLSIALELVDDPPILFLDEPTTGLDSSSSTQCIQILKNLAMEGKTIICTLHTPSALQFKMFDHVYAIADGFCIYQGSSNNLVPFLGDLDLVCPETFNPPDFLLEISTNDYGPQNHRLTEKIQNGANQSFRKAFTKDKDLLFCTEDSSKSIYQLSFGQQVIHLLHRNILISMRDKSLVILRLCIHLVLGIVFGFIYKDVGSEASMFLDNYRYIMTTVVFQLYTSYFSLQTAIPLEFPILKRERFNRWYSSTAYFAAFTLCDLPITFLCSFSYVTISYVMTDQPHELYRYCAFFSLSLALCYASQGIGLVGSALLDIKTAVIFSGIFLAPYFTFSSATILTKDAASHFKWLFEYNFMDNAIKGAFQSIFGYNRTKMECEALYCHYAYPNKILEEFEISVTVERALLIIIAYAIFSRIITFGFIKFRLKN